MKSDRQASDRRTGRHCEGIWVKDAPPSAQSMTGQEAGELELESYECDVR